jgi:small subunit ribosomal protein S4e
MVKYHLKALNAPRTWNVARRATIFTTRPYPGPHSFTLGFSLNHVLKSEIGVAKTTRDAQHLINNKECMINGKPAKDLHNNVGLLDVISLPKIKKNYRITLNVKGLLSLIEISDKEANIRISKITNKTVLNAGKIQINTLDGRNYVVKDTKYSTSDSLLIELPSGEVKKQLPFGEGATIMLISGKHIGSTGVVQKIDNNTVFFKKSSDNLVYETQKKFVFVVGKEKAEIKLQ